MKCWKCGKENLDESQFCNQCGASLLENKQVNKKKKKPILLISGIVIVLLILVFVIKDMNDPMKKFATEVDNNEVSEAIQIFNNNIKGDEQKETEAKDIVKHRLEEIKDLYTNEKMEFDGAIENIDNLRKLDINKKEFRPYASYINKLQKSRKAFEAAEEYIEKDNLSEALLQYVKVSEEDSNYEVAQTRISENEKKYVKEVIAEAAEFATKEDYKSATAIIREALKIMPKDDELIARKSTYDTKFKEQQVELNKKKAEEAKENQIAVVTQTKIVSQTNESNYKWIYPDMLSTYVKNLSDKTIRNLEVGILAYDSNGLPIKIRLDRLSSEGVYEFTGIADDANIVPNGIFGEGVGWKLDETHGISKTIANVKNVTFFDGETWYNEYYDTWLDEHKEKPLNE